MKLALSLAAVAGLSFAAIAIEPPADSSKGTKGSAAAPAAPTQEEMMKMWENVNKPGPEHKELGKLVGDWDMTIKSFNPLDPNETHESKATEKVEWLIDGRYVKVHTQGDMGGIPFTGVGINGYNNQTKKFESTWVDSMSTGQMLYIGTADGQGNLKMECQYVDPMSGGTKTSKMVCTWKDENTRGFKMFEVEGGKDVLVMDATYTRKSSPTGSAKSLEHGKKTEAVKTPSK